MLILYNKQHGGGGEVVVSQFPTAPKRRGTTYAMGHGSRGSSYIVCGNDCKHTYGMT
jgi:hypothetical protein